ncbi:MAG: hypothetical protein H7235_02705 [Bdellovibrionaceae bacterium]|nr:hypothetical protein [Pseudobdellovibrionaceae bacterium]
MKVEYRIAQSDDLDTIYQFAESRLKVEIPDDMERMIKIWSSLFRKESLEHYLKLGWSFIAENESKNCVGYFLGQPLLFFEGHTQTLWVEDVQAQTPEISADLIEISYKLSRDKHFQKVILSPAAQTFLDTKNIKYQPSLPTIWCKTTK